MVNDEAVICEITRATLEAYNYRVLTANDGMAAIALFAAHKDEIKVILIDIMMPTMDGLATVALLRRGNPHAPIIAMSGLHSTEAVAQAEKVGFHSFLAKPFTTRELLQVLHQNIASSPI